jgi:hypothetical protein
LFLFSLVNTVNKEASYSFNFHLQSGVTSVEMDTGNVPDTVAAAVHSSSVQQPDFWLNETDMWFQKVEASFRRAKITDSHVKLPESVLTSVKDVVRSVADTTADPYLESKQHLVSSYTLAMYLCRLPATIRDQLGAIEFKTPRAMAEHAALLWDARGGSAGHVAAIGGQKDHGRRRPSFKSPNRGSRLPNRGGRHRQQSPRPDGLCFCHHCFADLAYRFTPPCVRQGNTLAASIF